MSDTSGGYQEARSDIEEGLKQQRGLAERGVGYYDPYYQAGTGALGAYQSALAQGQDPTAFLQKILQSYRESPELQAQIQYGQQAANRAAAASGMLGSGAEMQHAAERAQALRSQDVQNYLSRILGLRQQYLSGEAGLAGQGLQSAGGINEIFGRLGQNIGQAYTGEAQADIGEAQAEAAQTGQILSLVGTVAGGLLGGPLGAAAGGALGGAVGGGGGKADLPLPFSG